MPYSLRFRRCLGVYQITNTISGDRYIGSSRSVQQRLLNHRSNLRNNSHKNKHLQNSWNKYGESAFRFRPLVYCESNYIESLEYELICNLSPEFNKSGQRGLGLKSHPMPNEWRNMMSERLRGRKLPAWWCKRISDSKLGENHHRAKFSNAEIEEFRKVVSLSGKLVGKIAELWGISQSYASRLSRGERR